jgi:hypothetical protein
VRPAQLLTPPSDEAGIPDAVNDILGIPDLVSPAYWVGEVVEAVLGVDPFGRAAEFLAGDWRGVAHAGSALRNLAAFDDAVAAAVSGHGEAVRGAWQGHASDAAAGYFAALAGAVSAGTPALKKLARELHTVAAGIWDVVEAVKAGLQAIADCAVVAAVSWAAGAALVETGVGTLAGYALAAFCITQMESAWAAVLESLNWAVAAAKALVGVLATTLTRLDPVRELPLPAAAYDHPGVGG